MGVAGIGVGGAERADGRAGGLVLCHGVVAQGNVRGIGVGRPRAGDCDVVRVLVAVVVRKVHLEAERAGRGYGKGDVEAGARAGGHAEGQAGGGKAATVAVVRAGDGRDVELPGAGRVADSVGEVDRADRPLADVVRAIVGNGRAGGALDVDLGGRLRRALGSETVISAGGDGAARGYGHRGPAVRGGTIPQLALAVIAAGPEGPVALHGQGVLAAGGERAGVGQTGDLDGRAEGARVFGAELTIAVVAPGVSRPVALRRQRVFAAAGKRGDVGQEAGASRTDDLDRGVPGRGGAIAQLTIPVGPPGPERPVRLPSQGVRAAGVNRRNAGQIASSTRSDHTDRGPLVVCVGAVA